MRLNARLLILLLLAAACQSSTEPLADVRVVTSVAARGIAGAPITISTTIVNGSNRAFTFDAGGCPRKFRIETASGSKIALREQICALVARPLTLAPRERYQFDDMWDGNDANAIQLIGAHRVIGQPFFNVGIQSAPVMIQLPQ